MLADVAGVAEVVCRGAVTLCRTEQVESTRRMAQLSSSRDDAPTPNKQQQPQQGGTHKREMLASTGSGEFQGAGVREQQHTITHTMNG